MKNGQEFCTLKQTNRPFWYIYFMQPPKTVASKNVMNKPKICLVAQNEIYGQDTEQQLTKR